MSAPLTLGEIYLQEAALLARLTPECLCCTSVEARSPPLRASTFSHLSEGITNTLRTRVKELLGETHTQASDAGNVFAAIQRMDELLEIDPSDTRHIFWEEMKRLLFALREIQAEDLDDRILDEITAAMDEVSNVLHKIDSRCRKREQRPYRCRLDSTPAGS